MPVYTLEGRRPELPANGQFWIAPNATVIGQVSLGPDVGIWFGAVLRGDTSTITIDAGTNVQDLTVIHADPGFPAIIGKDCTIGHRAIVHGCTIADNCLIGMGATVMNGARIAKNSLVGAGSLVVEGKEFPEGSLIIGSPARVARTLSPEEIARITNLANRYVANGRRFAKELQPL